VEALQEHLRGLLRERERLHRAGTGGNELERNRLEIGCAQRALAHALVARYSG
jgi:hypothetical protein